MTASYFGDTVLGLKKIYKVVDNVFDTMTMISQSSERMSHQECLALLMEEPLMLQMIDKSFTLKQVKNGSSRVTFAENAGIKPFVHTRLEEESQLSTDVSSVVLTPLNRFLKETGGPAPQTSRERSMMSSSNSSVALVPLTRLRVDAV